MKLSRPLLLLALAGLGWTALPAAQPDAQKTRELVAVVQSSAPLYERARACQQLTILGTAEAVPALAALLGDATLSHYAREALEAMPYPAAAQALRTALGTLKGDLLIGVVNSLGLRRDAEAVAPLLRLARDPASGAASEALLALGRIGTPEASRFLLETLARGPELLRAPAAEGCLVLAQMQLDAGQAAAATPLYDAVRAAPVAAPLRESAVRGALLARGAAGLPLLLEQLRSREPALRDVALRAARELPGTAVTEALIAELGRAPAPLQSALVAVLVDRADARALPALEGLAKSGAPEARLAALQALGRIGGASSVPLLLQTQREEGPAGDAALASLVRISAPDTDAAILAALDAAPAAQQARLIGLLGDRKAERAIPALLRLAQGADATLAKAALRALASVARPADQAELIRLSLALQAEDLRLLADRALAMAAMKVLEVQHRADAVLGAFRAATDPATKVALLRPLGAIVRSMNGSHEAFFVVQAALAERDATVREGALNALAAWPDATPSVALLEYAARADAPPALREIAYRGALRLAGNVAAGRERAPLDLLAFFTQANALARGREEKLLVVSNLGTLRRFESFQLLLPYLDDAEVRTEAALSVVQIAPTLLPSKNGPAVKAALEKIAAQEQDADIRGKAAHLAKTPPAAPAKQKAAPAPAAAARGPVPLFNGQDLAGWQGNPGVWRVRDGAIVGGSPLGNPRNEFLATTASYRNFVLRFECRLVGTEGFVNGGVQFRSVRLQKPAHEMFGYQADIGAGHSGKLYDESRRKKFLAEPPAELVKRLEKAGEWNRYEVRCEGTKIEISLNGEKTVAYTEAEPGIAIDGLIALQIHGNCKAEIAFRDLVLEPLP